MRHILTFNIVTKISTFHLPFYGIYATLFSSTFDQYNGIKLSSNWLQLEVDKVKEMMLFKYNICYS